MARFPIFVNQESELLSGEIGRLNTKSRLPALMIAGVRISDGVNVDAVGRALDSVALSHGGLRARFFSESVCSFEERLTHLLNYEASGICEISLFSQALGDPGSVPLRRVACPANPQPRADWIDQLLREEREVPFDRSRGSLIRGVLATIGPRDHVLLIVVDHIVCDGWSMRVIEREFRNRYLAYVGGAEQGAIPADDYCAHAARQCRATLCRTLPDHVSFWQKQWAEYGEFRVAWWDFPFVRSRPCFEDRTFETKHVSLKNDSYEECRRAIRTLQVSPHTFFLTAVTIVFLHYVGRMRIALSCYMYNRKRKGMADLVAFLANHHLIGIDANGDPTAADLAHRVRSAVLRASRFQELPLRCLWERLKYYPRVRDPGFLVDYRVVQTTINHPDSCVSSEYLTEPDVPRHAACGLYVEQRDREIRISVRFAAGLFMGEGIRELLLDITVVAAAIAENSAMRLSDFRRLIGGACRPLSSRGSSEMGELILLGSVPDLSK